MHQFKIILFFYLRIAFISSKKFGCYSIKLLKKIFEKKTVFLVSKNHIKTYSIGPLSQIALLFFALWIGSIFNKSLNYNFAIQQKSVEISNLKKINQQFASEVESLGSNIEKINGYLSSISGYKKSIHSNISQNSIDQKIGDIFGDTAFDGQDNKIATQIASSNLMLNNVQSITVKRINDLEQKLSIAGIALVGNKVILANNTNNKSPQNIISLNSKSDIAKRQGGPFREFKKKINSITKSKVFDVGNFHIEDQIKHLSNLENLIHKLPLAAPIKNYYVSSGFGKRSDPIKNTISKHEGMDFVGHNKAQIISPSSGKVIFAGKFGAYGNALIIDHGYGITTRYGHLSNIFVDEGTYVKKNQAIATQGSTGRSTGQHLHYEVRYKNIALDPKKFLEVGREILSENI